MDVTAPVPMVSARVVTPTVLHAAVLYVPSAISVQLIVIHLQIQIAGGTTHMVVVTARNMHHAPFRVVATHANPNGNVLLMSVVHEIHVSIITCLLQLANQTAICALTATAILNCYANRLVVLQVGHLVVMQRIEL